MKLVALLVAALLGIVNPKTVTPVWFPHGMAAAAPTCPYSSSTDGSGCANSPGGTTLHSGFFTGYAQQSGQTWAASRPARNQPGVDYAVGYTSVLASLTDIQVSQPAGCTLGTVGGAERLTCSNASGTTTDLTISGYRFDLHNGTGLEVSGYRNVTISNDLFSNGSATDPATDACLIRMDDNNSTAASTFTFTSDTLLGNSTNSTLVGYLVCDKRANTGSSTVFEYIACINTPGKCWSINQNNSTNFTSKWNYIEEISAPGASHSETVQAITFNGSGTFTPGTYDEEFNTELQTTGFFASNASFTPCVPSSAGCGGVEGFVALATQSATVTWTTITVSNNVWVVNKQNGSGGNQGTTLLYTGGPASSTLNVQNNWGDPTGASGCLLDTATHTTTNVSGNIDAIDNSAMNTISSSTTQCNGHF